MEPKAAIRALTKMFQVTGYAAGGTRRILRKVSEQIVDLLDANVCLFLTNSDLNGIEVAAAVSRSYPTEAVNLVGHKIPHCKVMQEGVVLWSESGLPECAIQDIGRLCSGAHLCIPMLSRGRMAGALSVGFHEPHTFSNEEIDVYLAISGAVTTAIENARLYKTVQDYASKLERRVQDRTEELSLLYECSRALTPTASMAVTCRNVVEQLAKATNSSAAILIDCCSSQAFVPTAQFGSVDPEHLVLNPKDLRSLIEVEAPLWREPTRLQPGRNVKTKTAAILSRCLGKRLLVVPLIEQDQLMQMVILGRPDGSKPYTKREIRISEAVGKQAALAIGLSREHEHDQKIAEAFQRSLLPPSVYKHGRFSIAGVYQPAFEEADVGGDIYDVWPLGNDRLAFVIGDVSGKGLKAAVDAAMIKYSLRAYSELRNGPATAVSHTNTTLHRWNDDCTFATLFYGELDVSTGNVVYSNAGHEPPLLIDTNTRTCVSLSVNGPAVAIAQGAAYNESSVVLSPNHILVLSTDGISEAGRCRHPITQEIITSIVCEAGSSDPSVIAAHIYEYALEVTNGNLHDDVAILVIATNPGD